MAKKKFEPLFSSDKMDWATPLDLFNPLNNEFNFIYDLCALPGNTKCNFYFSPEDDSLKQDWYKINGYCWLNPPYGKDIIKWLEKAYTESKKGAKIVILIPSRTDTKYWHKYCMNASEMRFIKGRVKFEGAKTTAPFPSVLIIFDGNTTKQIKVTAYDYKRKSNKKKKLRKVYKRI